MDATSTTPHTIPTTVIMLLICAVVTSRWLFLSARTAQAQGSNEAEGGKAG